jgi:DNA-directed RNA polymerase specialized sigma24 family protein
MTLEIPEAKCRIQAAMRHWPAVDDRILVYLRALHWRRRRALIMAHGELLSQTEIAARLSVSVATVQRDLNAAYAAYEQMFVGEWN